MMRRLSRSLLGAAVVALGLSGCSNQYFERKDTVTFSAGDAVAWNNAQIIADPAPRRAYDTNIVTPGVTAARGGSDYAQGRYRWYNDPSNTDESKEMLVSPDNSGGGGIAAGAAVGAAPGAGAAAGMSGVANGH